MDSDNEALISVASVLATVITYIVWGLINETMFDQWFSILFLNSIIHILHTFAQTQCACQLIFSFNIKVIN